MTQALVDNDNYRNAKTEFHHAELTAAKLLFKFNVDHGISDYHTWMEEELTRDDGPEQVWNHSMPILSSIGGE